MTTIKIDLSFINNEIKLEKNNDDLYKIFDTSNKNMKSFKLLFKSKKTKRDNKLKNKLFNFELVEENSKYE